MPVLLAAGYGTRIRALFPDTPKALIEIGGRPVLAHLLDNLERSGAVAAVTIVTIDRHHAALQVDGETNPDAAWYYPASPPRRHEDQGLRGVPERRRGERIAPLGPRRGRRLSRFPGS